MSSLFRSRHRRGSPDDEHGSGGKILRGRQRAPPASPYQRPALLQPPSAPRSPSWISGIFSSAGKLISSVFGEASSSEDEAVSVSSEDDIDASVEDLPALNQKGKEQEIIRDYGGQSSAIVPKTESKLVIEQLLKQETFSRDECTRLMEILQSRVVDYPSTEDGKDRSRNEIPSNTSGNAISSLGGYRSLNESNELQAVIEAKKWLEEKKLSTSKANFDCGPCTLNTDAIHYAPKRSYFAIEPWNTPEEVRRVRAKAKSSLLDSSSEQHLPSTGLLDHKASAVPSAAVITDSEGHCLNRAISLLNENGNEENHTSETCGVTSVTIVPKLSEAPETNQSTMATIVLPNLAVIGSETKLSDADTPILCENQDVDEPSEVREANNRFLPPSGSPVLPSKPMEHDGDPLSRTTALFLEKTKPTDPCDADVTSLDHVRFPVVLASSDDQEKLRVGKSSKLTSLDETTHDSRPLDGNYEVQNETERPYREIAVNGAPAEYNQIESSEPQIQIREGSGEIIGDAEADPVHASNSTEQRTTETPPSTGRRGKKTVQTPNSTTKKTETPPGPRSSRGKKAIRDLNSTGRGTTETPPSVSRRGKKAVLDPNSTEPGQTVTPSVWNRRAKKAVLDPNFTPTGENRRGKKVVVRSRGSGRLK